MIIHGTNDNIIPLEDGEKLSKKFRQDSLFEFFQVPEGDHNDIIKDHKTVVYQKIRQFLEFATKKNFSFNNESSKNEINSNFFRKLHPRDTIARSNSDKIYERLPFKNLLDDINDNVTFKNEINLQSTENEKKRDIDEKEIVIDVNKFEEKINEPIDTLKNEI